jgi:hypothetical protein
MEKKEKEHESAITKLQKEREKDQEDYQKREKELMKRI